MLKQSTQEGSIYYAPSGNIITTMQFQCNYNKVLQPTVKQQQRKDFALKLTSSVGDKKKGDFSCLHLISSDVVAINIIERWKLFFSGNSKGSHWSFYDLNDISEKQFKAPDGRNGHDAV